MENGQSVSNCADVSGSNARSVFTTVDHEFAKNASCDSVGLFEIPPSATVPSTRPPDMKAAGLTETGYKKLNW